MSHDEQKFAQAPHIDVADHRFTLRYRLSGCVWAYANIGQRHGTKLNFPGHTHSVGEFYQDNYNDMGLANTLISRTTTLPDKRLPQKFRNLAKCEVLGIKGVGDTRCHAERENLPPVMRQGADKSLSKRGRVYLDANSTS